MADQNKGYSDDEIYEQLRKIAAEEERIYGGRQVTIHFPNESKLPETPEEVVFDSDAESLIDDSEDPKLSKKMYYKIMSIINSNIPKGQVRDFVHNEKKLYLKSMSASGDSRFSFKRNLDTLLEIINDWVVTDTNGGDLAISFHELNEKAGFHKKRHIQQINDTSLNSLLNEVSKDDPIDNKAK